MQAGMTGINTIRIYNPTKQALEHDANGEFIYKWIPELANISVPLLLEPWKLLDLEVVMYQLDPQSRYLSPVTALELNTKAARKRLWEWRGRQDVKGEISGILERHVRVK